MRVIYVDGEEQERKQFEGEIGQIGLVGEWHTFSNEQDAVAFMLTARVDVAFLALGEKNPDGTALAGRLRAIQEELHIVFVSRDGAHALEAFEADAEGYLIKPCRKMDLERILQKIGRKFHIGSERRVYFRTMPRFDLFVDGRLVIISMKKVKEMLALLVDAAGGSVSSEQAITYLWEDRTDDCTTKALLRVTAKRLRDILRQEQIEFILTEENGVRAINAEKVSCDYYQLLKGIPEAVSQYCGEYMMEYSWAEVTNVRIAKRIGAAVYEQEEDSRVS